MYDKIKEKWGNYMGKYLFLSVFFLHFSVSFAAGGGDTDPKPWSEGAAEDAYFRAAPAQEESERAKALPPQREEKAPVAPTPWHVGQRHPFLNGDGPLCSDGENGKVCETGKDGK
ncbi:MAG: hypothetical protein C0514_02445 [Candidatus Puniceispirillum sp.]|nr:hypothetical protein [Candidatus Puniceispirillum sp.]